jgi:iron complex outermembrane receptor protein
MAREIFFGARVSATVSLRALMLCATAITVAAGGETRAADADASAAAAGATTLEDVVVTATRQSTQIQKTPVAVSVVSADTIADEGLVTARDLAGRAPGFTIQRAGITPLTQVFFIRGIGDSDPIFDPNVAVYIDDVYLPRAINGMTDLTDIERVELLRGPQGTLFGENADAGAIRYITKTPTDRTEANVDIGGGTYDALQIHGYLAGALIPGVLDGGLAIGHDQHNGYTYDPTIRRRVNDQDTTGARAKLLYTPTSKLSALFSVDGTIDRSATAYYIPEDPIIGGTLKTPVYGAFNPNLSYASQEPKNNSWTAGASLKIRYDWTPELTFNSISAIRGFAQDPVNYNNDGQPLVAYSPADPTPVSISDNYIVYREEEATQEFQLLGKFDKFDFTSGLYFLYENFSSNRIGYVVSPTAATALPAYPEDQVGDTKTYNYAVYVQGDYHFTSRLTGTLGARYTIETRDFSFQGLYDSFSGAPLLATPGAPTGTPGGYAAAYDFTYGAIKSWYSLTPKYGLSYQFTNDLYGYASISEGFDAGGFNNRASSLATALPYNQEKVTTSEIGLRSDWLQHRLRANVTAFYNQYDGLQETAAVISPVTDAFVSVRSNANRAHTEGVEVETAFQPVADLSLKANASYLWTRFDSFPNAAAVVVGGVPELLSATGNQLPLSPKWQLFTEATWRVPLEVPGDLRIGADATYETSYYSDVFNYRQGKVPDQGYIDAFLSYAPKGGRLVFTLTGRNLANRLSYQSITWGGTPNLWEGPVSPPRTIFFKVAYKL